MIKYIREVELKGRGGLVMIVYKNDEGNVRDVVITELALRTLYEMLKERYGEDEDGEEKGATGGEVVE